MTNAIQCHSGKVRFTSKPMALAAASRTLRRRDCDTRHFRAYRCPFCGGWHLTSQQRRAAIVSLAAVVACMLCSCVTGHRTVTGPERAAVPVESVRVLETAPAGAVEVGSVNVTIDGDNAAQIDKARAALRRQAALMGANVLVLGEPTSKPAYRPFVVAVFSKPTVTPLGVASQTTTIKGKAFYVRQ